MSFNMTTNTPKKRRPIADINITPMVDIMLVLLIVFMVAAPMIEQGVDLDLPQTETVPIQSPAEKFILRVLNDKANPDSGRIFIGKIEIPLNELEDKLKNNEKLTAEKEIFLQAEKKLSYGFVVKIMAIAKKAGVPKISLVTEPLEEE